MGLKAASGGVWVKGQMDGGVTTGDEEDREHGDGMLLHVWRG